jgi:DNA modification methylase
MKASLIEELFMQRPRALEIRKLPTLKPHPRNVRKHPAKQIDLLVKSFKQFNVTQPPLIDENNVILAGAARVIAARKAGFEEIPVIVRRDLSETQKRIYVLADNRLAELSGYDRPALADELQDLASLLAAEGLDFELTGFEPAKVDSLFADLFDQPGDLDETLPELCEEVVSRPGDLWILDDKHRVLCDDARHADYARLMQGTLAKMIFADVPYNIDITKALGRGRTKHRNFAMAAGEMSSAEYTTFLCETTGLAAKNAADGALCYFCIDWRHQREMLDTGAAVFDNDLKAVVVWAKTTPAQGSLYRSQHEFIYVYKHGPGPHLNNIELGKHGRNRSNVWTYPGANTFRSGRMADLAAHPTVKPIPLVADAIRDCTGRGDVVLDPFLGSGTTILAADKVGRRGYGIEIDPTYIDVAIRRWMTVTKTDAVLDGTDKTFVEIAAEREKDRGRS